MNAGPNTLAGLRLPALTEPVPGELACDDIGRRFCTGGAGALGAPTGAYSAQVKNS